MAASRHSWIIAQVLRCSSSVSSAPAPGHADSPDLLGCAAVAGYRAGVNEPTSGQGSGGAAQAQPCQTPRGPMVELLPAGPGGPSLLVDPAGAAVIVTGIIGQARRHGPQRYRRFLQQLLGGRCSHRDEPPSIELTLGGTGDRGTRERAVLQLSEVTAANLINTVDDAARRVGPAFHEAFSRHLRLAWN